jgi:hypothetical protein
MARKSGIIGGIIGFVLALIAEIPIYQNIVISLKIYSFNSTEFYIWGIVLNNGGGFGLLTLIFPENIIALTFWLILIFVSFNSIFASPKKSNPSNSLKLYNLNTLLTSILLIVYAIQIITTNFSNIGATFFNIGIGYYLLALILVLNMISKNTLKKGE